MTETQKSAIRVIDSMVTSGGSAEFDNIFKTWMRIMTFRFANEQTRSNQNNKQPDKKE